MGTGRRMPSATLNNSGPGSAIGQARKSHPPASFKIKGQGGIKGKDNTSLKQRFQPRGSHFPTSHPVLEHPGPVGTPNAALCCRTASCSCLWEAFPPFPPGSSSPKARGCPPQSRYQPFPRDKSSLQQRKLPRENPLGLSLGS